MAKVNFVVFIFHLKKKEYSSQWYLILTIGHPWSEEYILNVEKKLTIGFSQWQSDH